MKHIFFKFWILILPLFFAFSSTSFAANFPSAKITANPTVATLDNTFYFDAGSSSGNNLVYRFDFDNDGYYDTDFSTNPVISHIYTKTGIKRVAVQVKDGSGNTSWSVTAILVKEPDFKPKVKLSVLSQNSAPYKAVRGDIVVFNCLVQDDHAINSVNLRYDFDSDGIFDTTFRRILSVKHVFDTSGVKKVTVQAMDSSGNTSQDSIFINIVENTAPIAFFRSDKVLGTTATVFSFNASASSDDQSSTYVLKYRWDFNSDGTFDTHFQLQQRTEHVFSSSGKKRVTLQVLDPQGLTSNFSQEIEILSNSGPSASLEVFPYAGTYETRFTFDAGKSFDGQTDKQNLLYRFDFDYKGENDLIYENSTFSRNSKISRTFNKTGVFTVKVEVKDENGEIATAYSTYTIHWSSPYIDFLKRNSVMNGYKGSDMKPENQISRAEFITMIIKAKKIRYYSNKNFEHSFSDVTKKDWFYPYVLKAADAGIVSGYNDGTFKPNNPISRAEAVSIIMKSFSIREGHTQKSLQFKDVSSSSWYFYDIANASKIGVINGYFDGTFRPNAYLKRGEAAKIMYEALKRMR